MASSVQVKARREKKKAKWAARQGLTAASEEVCPMTMPYLTQSLHVNASNVKFQGMSYYSYICLGLSSWAFTSATTFTVCTNFSGAGE